MRPRARERIHSAPVTVKHLRASWLLFALSSAACSGSYDATAIERPIGPSDASVTPDVEPKPDVLTQPDTPTAPDVPVVVDVAPVDVAPVDVGAVDAQRPDVAPPMDAPPTDVTTPVDVPRPDVVVIDTPAPDVAPVDVTPVVDVPVTDTGTTCRACTAFAPVQFCPSTGSGACLAYAWCNIESCAVCVAATHGGDLCGADVPTITRRGRSRSVFTTCGVADNLDTGCGRSGPDIVVAARTETSGRVALTFTVPAGVDVYVGYDWLGNTSCRAQSLTRTCAGTASSTERSVSAMLLAGTYYAYITTSAPATVVVDAELP